MGFFFSFNVCDIRDNNPMRLQKGVMDLFSLLQKFLQTFFFFFLEYFLLNYFKEKILNFDC